MSKYVFQQENILLLRSRIGLYINKARIAISLSFSLCAVYLDYSMAQTLYSSLLIMLTWTEIKNTTVSPFHYSSSVVHRDRKRKICWDPILQRTGIFWVAYTFPVQCNVSQLLSYFVLIGAYYRYTEILIQFNVSVHFQIVEREDFLKS